MSQFGALWQPASSTDVDAADLTSGTATDGQVLTADGSGGAAWEATIQPDHAVFTSAIIEKSNALSASAINCSLGGLFTKTISGATTFTVSNVAASGNVTSFILELTNGGSAVITWWSGMTWAAGIPPTLTESGVDYLGFMTLDGGTTWRGLVLGKNVKAP